MTLAERLETHRCTGTPQLRLVDENQYCRDFICLTCYEHWRLTRSKLKELARSELQLERFRRLSEAERARHRIVGAYYQGPRHG